MLSGNGHNSTTCEMQYYCISSQYFVDANLGVRPPLKGHQINLRDWNMINEFCCTQLLLFLDFFSSSLIFFFLSPEQFLFFFPTVLYEMFWWRNVSPVGARTISVKLKGTKRLLSEIGVEWLVLLPHSKKFPGFFCACFLCLLWFPPQSNTMHV